MSEWEGQGRRRIHTHASSNDLMAFLIPSAPSASVPYGSLDEPEMLFSSDTRSDSSLFNSTKGGRKGKSQKGKKGSCQWSRPAERSGYDGHAPEQGEHVRKATHGQDLVLDHLAALGLVTIDWHHGRWWFVCALVELLLGAYIEHCSQHVRDCGERSTIDEQEQKTGARTHSFRRRKVNSS